MNRTGHPAGPLDRALVVELLAAFGDRARSRWTTWSARWS